MNNFQNEERMQIYNPSHLKLSRIYPTTSDIPSSLHILESDFSEQNVEKSTTIMSTKNDLLMYENDILRCTLFTSAVFIVFLFGLLINDSDVCTSYIRKINYWI